MNHELARSLFMDYLYDEIEEEEKRHLENYLDRHPDLQRELEEFRATRRLLQQMPMAEPDQQLMVIEPRQRTFSQWVQEAKQLLPQSAFGKFGMAVAAGLILLLFVGSAAKLHLDVNESGYSISMGYSPTVNQGMSPEQFQALADQIRQENTAVLTDYMQTIRQENQQQLQQVVRYVQEQRVNDLQLIDQNLEQLQQANNYRWRQTNQFLGEFLQTVNYQNQD